MNNIKRIYHPFWLWEETKFNMWGKSNDREKDLKIAIEFTGNHKKYGAAMLKVVNSWAYSCEHNLSNLTQNRRAWVGHAACAYELKIPEDIVRLAWGELTEKQQLLANIEADNAIKYWEDNIYAKNI